jgi:hypothetical protein
MSSVKTKKAGKQIVETTDVTSEVDAGDKFRSAKHWGKKELDLLEAIFEENPTKRLDLNTITTKDLPMPFEFQSCNLDFVIRWANM